MAADTTQLYMPEDDTAELVAQVVKSSAILNLSTEAIGSRATSTKRVLENYTVENDAQFHIDRNTPKTIAKDELENVEIDLYPLYKIIKLDEDQANDRTVLTNLIANRLPAKLAESIDKAVLGAGVTAPTTNFDTFTGSGMTPANVSDYATLTAAYSKVFENDGNATGWVMPNAFLSKLYSMFTTDGVPYFQPGAIGDGMPLFGATSYFRKGLTNGIVGDWSYTRFALGPSIKLQRIDTGITLATENKIAYKCELQFGFRIIDKTKFSVMKPAEATAGAGK